MSSLKDLASLIMIPSLYKDGELHTVKPLADENIIVHPDATDNNDGVDGTTPSTSSNFTFSRGSNLAATRVDVNGLIEKGRENLLLQSNQFDTTWTNTRSTETSGQSGYDGSSDAWLLESTATATSAYIRQVISNSGVYTMSVYAKAGTSDWVALLTAGNQSAYFDLQNGVLGSTTSNVVGSSIESIGNGWYRCSATLVDNNDFYVFIANGNGNATTNSGDNIYIQDAQLEQGLVATDYIETTTTSVSAGILEDMPRLDYSGSCPSLLLEPQRTNLFDHSEYFNTYWSYSDTTAINNSTISPQGLNNATKLIEGTSNTRHSVYRNPTTTASNNTISVFLKKGTRRYASIVTSDTTTWNTMVVVDLEEGVITSVFNQSGYVSVDKIENYGNGWYRVTSSINGVYAGNLFYSRFNIQNSATPSPPPSNGYQGNGTGYIYIFGAQMESSSSYPTSYIPTYGTSQTRSQDSGVLTSLPDSLADNYTIFLELERMVPRLTNAVDMFSFYGSGSSRIRVQSHNPDYFRVRFYAADGSSSGSLYETSGDFAQGNNYKAAIVYSNGTFKCFANGSLFGTLDVVIDVSSSYLRTECIAKQVLTFPTALTDSECIALTTL